MSTQQLAEASGDGFSFGPEGGSNPRFVFGPGEPEGSLSLVPGRRIFFPGVWLVRRRVS